MTYKLQYWLSVVTAVIEGLFFTGLIFGWTSISSVLVQAGYFSYLCESADNITLNPSTNTTLPTSCKSQDEIINLIFTVASAALSFSTLPNGFIFDYFGTWISRTIGTILFTLGSVLVTVSSVDISLLLFPAMCCFAIGGILLLITNMQLGNLFGSARSSVITLLSGALDSSSFVFLLVKYAYDGGISLNVIFGFISCTTVLLWIRTFFLMPRMHIPFSLPKDGVKYGIKQCTMNTLPVDADDIQLEPIEIMKEVVMDNENVKKIKGFTFYLRTMKFWMNLLHFSLLQLRNYFFLGTFISWLKTYLGSTNNLDTYLSAFGICQFFGIVTAPLNGMLIDFITKHFKTSCNNSSVVSAKAAAISAFVTSFLGIIFSVIILIPSIDVQYLTFLLQVIFRSFLYGGNFSFIALLFPGEHFGKIYGLTMTLAGVVSLLQFPLYSLVLRVFDSNFLVMNMIFLCVCILTLTHPIMLYYSSYKEELQIKQPQDSEEQTMFSEDYNK